MLLLLPYDTVHRIEVFESKKVSCYREKLVRVCVEVSNIGIRVPKAICVLDPIVKICASKRCQEHNRQYDKKIDTLHQKTIFVTKVDNFYGCEEGERAN